MPTYRVIMKPAEDQPQTFTDTNEATGEDFERDAMRSILLNAPNEDAAKLLCERQAFDIATQEVSTAEGYDPEDADANMEAIMSRQWRIASISERDAEPAAEAPTESAPEA